MNDTAAAKPKPQNVMTPEFRVAYANVFRPTLNKLSNKMECSMVALFKKGEDLNALKKEALRAITDRWGADKEKWPKNLRTPFRDQGEKTQEGYVPGAIFVNLKSKERPGLIDNANQPIIDETQFYSGCYAKATVRAYAYPKAGVVGQTPGVAFGLQNIQKQRDGESLSGRVNAEKEFAPIADAEAGQDAAAVFDI